MGARKPYFDRDLCDLVDGLFEVAAGMTIGGKRPFAGGKRGRASVDLARLAFGITKNDISCWRREHWPGGSADRPVEFNEHLLWVFEGGGDRRGIPDPALAQAVRDHWRSSDCRDGLELATTSIRRHLARLKDERERRAAEGSSTARATLEATFAPILLRVPPYLAPPDFADAVRRDKAVAQAVRIGQRHFSLIIEGPPGAGKQRLARFVAERLAGERAILWYRLEPSSSIAEIVAQLCATGNDSSLSLDRPATSLVDWLVATNALLVLDGLNGSNYPAMAPLLRQLDHVPGPARLLATSTIRIGGTNSYEAPPLTAMEITSLLAQLSVDFDDKAVAAAVALRLTPFQLVRIARGRKSLDAAQIEAADSELAAPDTRSLSASLRALVEVIRIIGHDVDLEDLTAAAVCLGLEASAQDLADHLERDWVISRASAGTWRLDGPRNPSLRLPAPITVPSKALVRLADYFEKRASSVPAQSPAHCSSAYSTCRLLQAANSHPNRRSRLLRQVANAMARQGDYLRLAALYAQERRLNSFQPAWNDYKLAHAYHVLGRYEDAIEVLEPAIRRGLKNRQGRDQVVHLAQVRLLAEVLVELGRPGTALKLLDRSIANADVSKMDATPCVQAVSALSWALVASGQAAASRLLDEDVLGKQFIRLSSEFTNQVANVRGGAANRALGRLEDSLQMLMEARDYFRGVDARALAWSSANLALTLDAMGRRSDAAKVLEATIEINVAFDFFSGDLAGTYSQFDMTAAAYAHLDPALKCERERIESRERARHTLVSDLEGKRLVEHVLYDLGGDPDAEFEFDLERYVLFSAAKPWAVGSAFCRNLINRLVREGPERPLDLIFQTAPPSKIFNNHLYNKLISEACRSNHALVEKYIKPHLEALSTAPGSIVFFYARTLEYTGYADAALALIEKADANCFEYHNIRANCLMKSAPQEALREHDRALQFANRRQRAQTLHNKAKTIYLANMRSSFAEAASLCEQAIGLRDAKTFPWPQQLLLKLKLRQARPRRIGRVLREHQARFGLSKAALLRILEDVTPASLRRAALDAMPGPPASEADHP